MANKFGTLFSYYGAKSKIARFYSKPRYKTIIEPFGGGASYSLLYYYHDVIVNEINPAVVSIWRFLQSKEALQWVDKIPERVEKGQYIKDIVEEFIPGAPAPLIELLHSSADQACYGKDKKFDKIYKFGAKCWPRLKPRLKYYIPKIQHWKILSVDFSKILNRKACWFVDPPYSNKAGLSYKYNLEPKRYDYIANWVKSRRGQVIVCEDIKADYLKFKPLKRSLEKLIIGESASMEAFCELENGEYYKGIRDYF